MFKNLTSKSHAKTILLALSFVLLSTPFSGANAQRVPGPTLPAGTILGQITSDREIVVCSSYAIPVYEGALRAEQDYRKALNDEDPYIVDLDRIIVHYKKCLDILDRMLLNI